MPQVTVKLHLKQHYYLDTVTQFQILFLKQPKVCSIYLQQEVVKEISFISKFPKTYYFCNQHRFLIMATDNFTVLSFNCIQSKIFTHLQYLQKIPTDHPPHDCNPLPQISSSAEFASLSVGNPEFKDGRNAAELWNCSSLMQELIMHSTHLRCFTCRECL